MTLHDSNFRNLILYLDFISFFMFIIVLINITSRTSNISSSSSLKIIIFPPLSSPDTELKTSPSSTKASILLRSLTSNPSLNASEPMVGCQSTSSSIVTESAFSIFSFLPSPSFLLFPILLLTMFLSFLLPVESQN